MPAQLPSPPPIELGDQNEHAMRSRVDMSRQRRDLVAQLLQRIGVVEGINRTWRRRR